MTHFYGYRKGQLWEYLAVSLVIAAVWVNWFFRGGQSAIAGPMVATCLIVGLAAFAWRGLFNRSNVLCVSVDGVWCRTWATSSLLPWSEVKAVTQVTAPKGEPFISLLLKDEPSLLKLPEFSGMQHQAESWHRLGCSAFTLRVSLLNITTDKATVLLNRYLAEDKMTTKGFQSDT